MTNQQIKSGLKILRTQIDGIRRQSDENAERLERIALEAISLIKQVDLPATFDIERVNALTSLSESFTVTGKYLYQEEYKDMDTFMKALNLIDGAIDIFLYKTLETPS